MRPTRLIHGVAAAGVVALLQVGPAAAQYGCGTSYVVQPGDTLSKIAARCGTSVSALTGANAFIRDPARIEVGWRLAIPGAGYRPAAPAPREPLAVAPDYRAPVPDYRTAPADPYGGAYGNTYTVQPGETIPSIAQALGLSIAALIAENSGVDPGGLLAGQLLRIPMRGRYDYRYDDRRDLCDLPELKLKPDEGRRGSKVELRVDGLVPRERVLLGALRPNGGVVRLGEARADRKGKLRADLRVPDWADPRRDLIFVVELRDGIVLRSEPFEVEGRRADRRNDRRDDRDVALEGWIVQGVECAVLRTPGGRSYSLVSDRVALPYGAYVELRGEPVAFSICQEGAGTVEVTALRQVDPPR